ncbi:MAG: ATP-binding protein [Mariprofundaceae bacterium]|nr:ATP-binding protein [Mariprofundaceae bacterium]
MKNKLSLTLPAQCDCVFILRSMVNVLCKRSKLSAIEKNRVGLAVDELYANIVRHGYQGEPKPLTFDAEIMHENEASEALMFTFQDCAPVFDISAWKCGEIEPCCAETITAGGLGIPLIHAIMDEVKHEALEHGNRWTLLYRSKKNIKKEVCDA